MLAVPPGKAWSRFSWRVLRLRACPPADVRQVRHSARLGTCHVCVRAPPFQIIMKFWSAPSSVTKVASVCASFQRYVRPYAPVAVFTRNRVSTRRALDGSPRRVSRSKCFTHTAPVGSVQGPSLENPNVLVVSGSANQRRLVAWSDQNETFGSYATTPAAGVSVKTSANAPVADKNDGSAAPPVGSEATSRLIAFSVKSHSRTSPVLGSTPNPLMPPSVASRRTFVAPTVFSPSGRSAQIRPLTKSAKR